MKPRFAVHRSMPLATTIALALVSALGAAVPSARPLDDAAPVAAPTRTSTGAAAAPAGSGSAGAPAAPPAPAAPSAKPDPGADPAAREPAVSPIFRRVGLIGASATAGFGVRVDAPAADGAPREILATDLGDLLLASCSKPIVVSRHGSIFFFSDPLNTGRSEVDRVLRFKPTVVIGVDFFFWYGYGTANIRGLPLANEDERLELLEEGLRQADRVVALGVPVVLGDFPDMRDSIGRLLSREQVPQQKTLARLNARIAEWASTRPNVRILHLSHLVPTLDGGDSVVIRGRTWNCGQDGAIVQRDRLHPTLVGCLAMLSAACELAETCTPDGTCSTLDFDPATCTPRLVERLRGGRNRATRPNAASDPSAADPAPREGPANPAPAGAPPATPPASAPPPERQKAPAA